MKFNLLKIIGLISVVCGIGIIIATIFVGVTSFTSDFDDLCAPFIVMGISNGIIISLIGILIYFKKI